MSTIYLISKYAKNEVIEKKKIQTNPWCTIVHLKRRNCVLQKFNMDKTILLTHKLRASANYAKKSMNRSESLLCT